MSLTPIDEGQGTQPDVARRETSSRSRRKRLATALRSLVEALPFGRRLLGNDSSPDSDELSSDHRRSKHPLVRRSSDCSSFESLPRRDRPFTSPPVDSNDQNLTDLVGEQRGETLTIMYPDCPDTSITSDIFVEVEP